MIQINLIMIKLIFKHIQNFPNQFLNYFKDNKQKNENKILKIK